MNLRPLIDPHSALSRVIIAATLGVLIGGAAHLLGYGLPALIGWNAGGATMLLLAWRLIGTSDEATTRARAGAEDPGRSLVYGIVLVASSVSLFAALQLTRHPATLNHEIGGHPALQCLISVALAWAMTHTAFTLRYAHLYYREDKEGVGGVAFPGQGTPTYFDFAYFAFTIGMCFQTSDVCVTSTQIRRTVLLQAIIAFVYTTAIIAFVLNLVFGQV